MDDQTYDAEKINEIVKTICFFEKRYGGTFEEVVKRIGNPYTSSDWKWWREGLEWHWLLKEMGDL